MTRARVTPLSDDILLQAKAREAIQAGHLPKCSPHEVWGGPATGVDCAVCGAPTIVGGVELEFKFPVGSKLGRTTYYAHPRCFSIFSREVAALLGETVSPGARRFAESGDGHT
jgi:hypothetical protein